MAVNAGLLPLHKNVLLMVGLPTPVCSANLLTFRTETTFQNFTLYGSLPPISSTLRSRRLQFAGHCFRRVEEPIHSVLFFEPAGTFRPGGHIRKIKTLLRDSGLSTSCDPCQAMASRDELLQGRRRRFHCLDLEQRRRRRRS